jgi:hypothetical protein
LVAVDQASFPSDTMSAHAIARSGVVQLRRWRAARSGPGQRSPGIRQVTFHVGGESVSRTIKHKAAIIPEGVRS